MFTQSESALAYAKSAERILGEDASYLNDNREVVPIFVSMMFQSLEISLKHIGLETNLFTESESRDRKLTRNGHGINELATLASSRLGSDTEFPIILAMTFSAKQENAGEIIGKMVYGKEFEATRNSYASRALGYSEVDVGDFQIVRGVKSWVVSVREVAANLPKAIEIIDQWSSSTSRLKSFALWYTGIRG